MDTRIALIGIIVEDLEATKKLNAILHEYEQYLVGRMGIPYRQKDIRIISVVIDATNDIISSLSGKLGMIEGINIKTLYSKSGK
jgi:putative iron-only hydrogenase system regulator